MGQSQKEIFDSLDQQKLFDYGNTIHKSEFLRLFGLNPLTEEQSDGMKLHEIIKRVQSDELKELAIVDYVRRKLLAHGKFLSRDNDNYRVALPSENAAMADKYMRAATRKIRRARTLLKSTPPEVLIANGSIASRLLIAERQIKHPIQ